MSSAISAQVDPPLSPCRGALEDGLPRLLAVPSSLGAWTFLQAGGGLSHIPAATLLQRPSDRSLAASNNREGEVQNTTILGGPGDCKYPNLNALAREGTLNSIRCFLPFTITLITCCLGVGRGRPATTRS